MHCENCGGTLSFMDSTGHFQCEFCDAFRFAKPLADSIDRIKPVGTSTDIACPVCAISLKFGKLDKAKILYCDTCRGLLITNGAFREMIHARRAGYVGPIGTPRPLESTAYQRHVACPQCNMMMEVHPYYGPGNVVIDSCVRCNLVWFDHGEVRAIEIAPGLR